MHVSNLAWRAGTFAQALELDGYRLARLSRDGPLKLDPDSIR
jgi:hypothetical protein